LKFLFDNCVSINAVEALRALLKGKHIEILHLTDRFLPNTSDEVWLTELGNEGDWVIISADPRITHGKAEKAAWKSCGLTVFFYMMVGQAQIYITKHPT